MYYILVFLVVLVLVVQMNYWERLAQILSKYYLNAKELIPDGLIKNGKNLVLNLSHYSSRATDQEKDVNMPHYKYFTKLILDLYQARRVYGAEIQKHMLNIKSAILSDLQFEKKVKSLSFNSYSQFFAMSLLTWGFIFLTSKIMSYSADPLILFLIIFMQLIGSLLFFFIFKKVKKTMMDEIGKIEAPIYTMKALIRVGIPVSLVCERCEMDQLSNLKNKSIRELVERLFYSIDRLKNEGTPIESTLSEILDEVYFIRDQKFNKFINIISFFKFIILALFYLTSYFVFIISLFFSLLQQI